MVVRVASWRDRARRARAAPVVRGRTVVLGVVLGVRSVLGSSDRRVRRGTAGRDRAAAISDAAPLIRNPMSGSSDDPASRVGSKPWCPRRYRRASAV
jgi:hypothetical protein